MTVIFSRSVDRPNTYVPAVTKVYAKDVTWSEVLQVSPS